METISTSLASGLPLQRPVTQSFDILFVVILYKLFNKQLRHFNSHVIVMLYFVVIK